MRKIDKEILKLAAPAIVNNITVPLLGLCDTAIAGHLGSATYIGAIAVGAMMLNVVFWLFGFLRMGTSGLAANALGADKPDVCRDVLRRSLMIALGVSAIVLILQIPLLKLLMFLVGAENSISLESSTYFKICVWGVPAQLCIMAFSGWFVGMQNTTIPMGIAIGMNIINIILSVTLTVFVGLGFRGIAFGTLAANWIGAVAMFFVGWPRVRQLPAKGEHCAWRRLFGVNTDLFFRSMFVMGVSLTVTAVGARLGVLTLAVNAVMMQFFIFFSYFMDGFAFAAEALTGRFFGAGDKNGFLRAVRALLRWSAAMAVIFFLVYLFGTEKITSLLTNESDVIAGVMANRVFVILLPPLTVLAFIYDGIYIGMTRTRAMLLATFTGALAFVLIEFMMPFVFPETPARRLWLAFETYLLLRGLFLALGGRFNKLNFHL